MTVDLVIPDQAAVTRWLLALAATHLPVGQKVGDFRAPDPGSDGVQVYPYHTLYSIPGGTVDGPPMGAAQSDVGYLYQLDSVGRTRDQAEQLASRGRNTISGRGPGGAFAVVAASPAGMLIRDRISEGSVGAPIVEGVRPNEVYTISDRFMIYATVAD